MHSFRMNWQKTPAYTFFCYIAMPMYVVNDADHKELQK